MHAREQYGLGTIPIVVLFSIPRGSLHIPSLVGRTIRLIAQRLCLPHREYHSRQKIYYVGTDEEQMACRFPNPVPLGTRVPQWALLDITVRCYVFFNGNIFTTPSTGSLRTIGTQTSLLQSAVRTLFLSFSHYQCLTPTACFLDSPEQAAGVILGPSGATVSSSASGTRSGATSSLSGESSSTAKPTSSPTSKSSSNMGIIVGGAVGGVVVIALAAIAIGFFLRQRRSEAPASVAPPFVGASQPHMDEIQQPLTMDDGYTSSIPGTIGSSMPGTPLSPMRIYVRVSCPLAVALLCVLIPCGFLPILFFFDTQNPNDPSTFPGYQGPEYQGVPQTPATPPQGPVPSANGTGNSLATMQTAQGYHGLPTV
jgi:hypothetical protein